MTLSCGSRHFNRLLLVFIRRWQQPHASITNNHADTCSDTQPVDSQCDPLRATILCDERISKAVILIHNKYPDRLFYDVFRFVPRHNVEDEM